MNQFSKKFDTFFNNEYRRKTLEYFEYKCPYSGLDLSNNPFVMDHIVPINWKNCGLHIYGNILLVSKEANSNKHDKPLESFLAKEPEKLIKIQNFIRESGYKNIHEKYNEQLKLNCKQLYKKIRTIIEGNFEGFINRVKVSNEEIYPAEILSVILPPPPVKPYGTDIQSISVVSNSKLLKKNNAIDLINKKTSAYLDNSNTIFSNVNKGKNVWWFQPDNSKFNSDLNLVLNNAKRKTLYHFFIPKNDITNPKETFYQRADYNNHSHIEIYDDDPSFKDIKKSFSFKKYFKNEIKY